MVSYDCNVQKHPTRSRPLVLDACSSELAVRKPAHTVVLDASKGSLCEVVISACVNTIIVKGNKDSFVSVVFQPTFNNAQSNITSIIDYANGKESQIQQNAVTNNYEVGNIRIGKIHTFSVLGVARGVTFGNIVNQAKYFTIDQTQDVLDYGLVQGGIANGNWNRKLNQLVNSDTFIVGSFTNYGHFLVKTTNVGSVSYSNCNSNVAENCELANGNSSKDSTLIDNRTFWLVNVLIKCKFTSTGRNKNFRVPVGILYLWAGADVRLCNVSCESISPPEAGKCFDAVCYDSDATKAPLINCVAVVCGITEILPDTLPCSPNAACSQSAVWNQCGNDSSYQSSSDDCSSEHSDHSSPVIFGKNFKALTINPCFIKKASLVIKNSDVVVCDLVKRVWTLPLGCQVIDNASCDPHNPRPFISTSFDQTYVKTVQLDECGNHRAINSSRIYSYLLNLEVKTPALYVGKNIDLDSEWNMSNINVQRFVYSLGKGKGDNGWPHHNGEENYGYAIMFSKCRDDPVVDPKTTLPRRCCDLNGQYSIPDRVRPYCHRIFAPTQLSPVCRPIVSTSDVLNTVCAPACAQLCEVLPSHPAKGKQASTHVILNKNCCQVPVPSKNVCIAKSGYTSKASCEPIDKRLADDWDECSIDSSSKSGNDWKSNNGAEEWDDTCTNSD